jgi:hypothetical protein
MFKTFDRYFPGTPHISRLFVCKLTVVRWLFTLFNFEWQDDCHLMERNRLEIFYVTVSSFDWRVGECTKRRDWLRVVGRKLEIGTCGIRDVSINCLSLVR